jgi:hypothetical protein
MLRFKINLKYTVSNYGKIYGLILKVRKICKTKFDWLVLSVKCKLKN